VALNPSARYPGQIDAHASYPHGKARNVSAPGDGTGTPWERDLVNDLFGFQQALLGAASIVPSGNADTAAASQYLQAIQALIAAAAATINARIDGVEDDQFGRIWVFGPPAFLGADWNNNQGTNVSSNMFRSVAASAGGPGLILMPVIRMPVTGVITGFGMNIDPVNNGRPNPPSTPPTIALHSWNQTAVRTVHNTATDTSASGALYEGVHAVSVTGLSIAISQSTHCQWYLSITNETGSDSSSQLDLESIWVDVDPPP
jgi:hypothetical protein